jgi:hypothetical protein
MSEQLHELTEVELEDYERECREHVISRALECEQRWRLDNAVFCWIEREPAWITAHGLWDMALPRPEQPCRRILRLCLAGGGQLNIREKHVVLLEPDGSVCKLLRTIVYEDPQLGVIPHLGDHVIRVRGTVQKTRCYEMDQSAVVLRGDQALADRVAATLRVIEKSDDLFALFDGSAGCAICGRSLRDEVSKLLNIGPECARKLGRPHNLAAASLALQHRRALLERACGDLAGA